MIKAVIFDNGGVIDNGYRDEFLFEYISKKLNLSVSKVKKVIIEFDPLVQIGKISIKKFWEIFSEKADIDFPKNYQSLLSYPHKSTLSFNPNMLRLIDKLKESYQVAMLTNSCKPHTTNNRNRGIYNKFKVCIISNEVGIGKPESGIYYLCCDALKLKPSECLFIDDRKENIDAAKLIGMKGIVFNSYEQLLKEFKKYKIKF